MKKHPDKKFNNLIELAEYFKSDELCRKYLEKLIWNGVPVCPHCGKTKVYSFSDGKRYKCASNVCYKQFTVTVGTFFESTKVPLRKWFHALYLFSSHKKGISSHQLARDLSVTQKTSWFMLGRLREVFTELENPILEGIFEVDETYVGGKEKNKHQSVAAKNKRSEAAGLRPGSYPSGHENKITVFGMLQREGNVRNFVLPKGSSKQFIPIIQKNVKKGSVMFSDEFQGYKHLPKFGYKHETVQHGLREYVRGDVHTANLDSYWSGLKRGIVGIYHQVSRKHLHRYCNEFSYRYNTRKLSEVERFEKAITQCKGRLKYDQLIAEK